MTTMGLFNVTSSSDLYDPSIASNIDNTTEAATISNCNYEFYNVSVVDRIVTPFIWAIGFPGNILSLVIWMNKRMRHSSGFYLAALALNDLVFLALNIAYELEMAWGKQVLRRPGICQAFPMVYYTAQFLSLCLVLAFTTERYISICHPFKRETFCTMRRAKMVILILVGVCFLITSPYPYFFTIKEDNGLVYCEPRDSVMSGSYLSVYNLYDLIIGILFTLLVPVAIMVLNLLVIREMRRLSRMEQATMQGTPQKGSPTAMLLTVSFYQIITTLPVTGFSYYTNVRQTNNDCPEWLHMAAVLVDDYGYSHYAINIIIYILTGAMFRQQLKLMIVQPFRKLAGAFSKEYSSLRSSRASSRTANTWLSTNGREHNHSVSNDPRADTLL